jgi:methionyl-tRNA formyltransferase
VRLVFWGTPQFADTVLRALIDAGREVVGVVTQPDRPAGRGRVLQPPPVKLTAAAAGIPVLQPERPWGEEFMASLRAREPGVTIMRMVEQLDAGPMILKASCAISPDATAGALTARLAELGGEALLEALALIEAGAAVEELQEETEASYAPKLSADDVRIDWSRPAEEIDRWIRGADPVPAAWTELGGLRVRVFVPRVVAAAPAAGPGVVVTADPRGGLEVATGSGVIGIGQVQPAGKRRMEAVEWIRGRGIEQGSRFE